MYISENYKQKLNELEDWKSDIMDCVVKLLKKNGEPITIGNGTYWYVSENGKDVPAYKDERLGFKPMYDKECTYDFGWADFMQCCYLFDMIENRLLGFNK